MVVDDEPMVSRMLSRMLASRGWKTTVVSDGRAALAVFAAGRYQAVFCDICLGAGWDGIEVCRRLRTIEPGLKVVLMTGSLGCAKRARASGLGPVVEKPFTADDIMHFLSDHGAPPA